MKKNLIPQNIKKKVIVNVKPNANPKKIVTSMAIPLSKKELVNPVKEEIIVTDIKETVVPEKESIKPLDLSTTKIKPTILSYPDIKSLSLEKLLEKNSNEPQKKCKKEAVKKSKKISDEELKKRREMGQFYTTSPILHEKLMEFIKNNPSRVLEPSCGRGDILLPFKNKFPDCIIDAYEIDESLEAKFDNINYCNFLEKNIDIVYDTIIGNPPFVKTKKGNLAIDFVKKCFGLLDKNGELIFIVPADFFKLTSTGNLINEMMQLGVFTDIFHPEADNLFEHASINVMLFRYCKNKNLPKICNYNGVSKNIINNNGLLIFTDQKIGTVKTIDDYFDIYVGLVSGRDEIYKSNIGNIELLVQKDEYEKFIYSKIFPTVSKEIDEHLLKNKDDLLSRKIRKFNDDNWFEWGAPRNVSVMEERKGKKCIYVYNLTRKDEIAFEGEVGYFCGNLIMMIPKDNIDLKNIVKYLNSQEFKKNYIYGGRFKIGHRQLCNALLRTT